MAKPDGDIEARLRQYETAYQTAKSMSKGDGFFALVEGALAGRSNVKGKQPMRIANASVENDLQAVFKSYSQV